jgi:hypothetical protein
MYNSSITSLPDPMAESMKETPALDAWMKILQLGEAEVEDMSEERVLRARETLEQIETARHRIDLMLIEQLAILDVRKKMEKFPFRRK